MTGHTALHPGAWLQHVDPLARCDADPSLGSIAVIDRDLLRRTELFSELDDAALARVAAAAVTGAYERGDVVFAQDDVADHLYMLLDGRIAITNRADDGRESMFALLEGGDLFGEMGLLDGLGRSAEARALEPSTAIEIPFDVVRTEFNRQPALLWNVARLLAGRLRSMDATLADSLFLDVTGRAAKRLLELANGADEFTLPVTQEELAGMIGASRERVNKALIGFSRLGWVTQHESHYTIVDREALARRAR